MSVETDFYSAVTGDATLAALVGTRVYPAILPDNATLPAMVYSVISQVPIGSGGCESTRVQVDCYAAKYYTDASGITGIKSLRDGLLALAQATGNWTHTGGPDFYDDELNIYRQVVDLIIAHSV